MVIGGIAGDICKLAAASFCFLVSMCTKLFISRHIVVTFSVSQRDTHLLATVIANLLAWAWPILDNISINVVGDLITTTLLSHLSR